MMARRAQQRRSVRWPGYDYASPGAYFVTICTFQRQLFFDQPQARRLAEACWREIPAHVDNVELDEWVVMPNHIHGIIVIGEGEDEAEGRGNQGTSIEGRGVQSQRDASQLNAPTTDEMTLRAADSKEQRRDANNPFSVRSPRRQTLGVIIRTYKAAVTTAGRGAQLDFAWQRGYYEHVVRDQRELEGIRRYIRDNPLKWAMDRDKPANGRLPAGSAGNYLDELPA